VIDEREIVRRAVEALDPPEPAFERLLHRRDRKRRNQRIAAGVLGIAVFVAAVWIVTSVGSFDRTHQPAIQPTPTPEPSLTAPEVDYLLDLDTGEATPLPESIVGKKYPGTEGDFGPTQYAASPDGSRLAYSAPGENGQQIFVANLDGTGIEQVTRDVKGAISPAWSPDGSKIAFVGSRGDESTNIFVLDLATGVSTQLTFESALPGGAPSFSPDESSIAYVAGRWGEGAQLRLHGPFEVWTVPVTGGESVRLMDRPFHGGRLSGQVAWLSPDGSLLSYSCVMGFAALCIANADGTDARVLARGAGISRIDPGGWSPDGKRITYSEFPSQDVFILDVVTGQATYVAEGGWPTWLDDHTLIIEIT
jgi:dipeptidyl aminopeptidase/acylaminoacyl peptidase